MELRIREVTEKESEDIRAINRRHVKTRIIRFTIFAIVTIAVISAFLGGEAGTAQAMPAWFAIIMGVIIYALLPLIGVSIAAWIVIKILK